jgi:DNA processing protein
LDEAVVTPETVTQEEQLAWLKLTLVPSINARTQQVLLSRLGSALAVTQAPPGTLAGIVGGERASALVRGPQAEVLDAAVQWLAAAGRHLVTLADEDYPQALLQIADPPSVLYVHGRRDLLNAPAIAIVGSRNATPVGVRDAESFAHALSEAGLCVVSGLALGIDAAAHRGGLSGRGSSIAVMGTGADRIYPAANRTLAHRLAQEGCLVTDFPVGTPAATGNFPRRNRLISGLSRGVLIVEAAMQSGSLITARLAVEQNREVFAVPGSIHSALSKGCHALIRDGAKLVESADDVLAELGLATRTAQKPQPEPSHPLLEAMGFAPVSIDEIATRTRIPASSLAVQLTQLEIEGKVQALDGGRFQRIDGRRIE